jgi:hypothetical protein
MVAGVREVVRTGTAYIFYWLAVLAWDVEGWDEGSVIENTKRR